MTSAPRAPAPAEVAAAYQAGATVTQLAAAHGTSAQAISDRLTAASREFRVAAVITWGADQGDTWQSRTGAPEHGRSAGAARSVTGVAWT